MCIGETSAKGAKKGKKEKKSMKAAYIDMTREDRNPSLRIFYGESNRSIRESQALAFTSPNRCKKGKRQKKSTESTSFATTREERNPGFRSSDGGSNYSLMDSQAPAPTSPKRGKQGKNQKKSTEAACFSMTREERNPGLRSPGREYNSSLRESQSPAPNSPIRCEDETISKYANRPPRGKAKGVKDFKNKKRVELQFNSRCQYYGKYASGFSSFLGITAREFVPLTTEWKDLSDFYKSQIWSHILVKYVVPEACKRNVWRKMIKLWGNYRSLTLKSVRDKAESVGLPRAAALLKPDNIDSMEAWLRFVKSRTTAKFLEECERFKLMRQQRSLMHRTSRKSFACVEDELKQQSENPDAVTRSDVWLEAYEVKTKAGEEEEVPEIVKLVRKYKEEEDSTEPCSIKVDAVAKALGPDPRGRVRGLGFGALPSKVDGQTHVTNKVTMLENALASQTQQVQQLSESVKELLAQIANGGHVNENTSNVHSGNWIAKRKRNQKYTSGASSSKDKRSGEIDRPGVSSNKDMISREIDRPKKSQKRDAGDKVELLSWFSLDEQVVVIGGILSKDPESLVHHVPLGHDCWKISVYEVFQDIALFRPTSEFSRLDASTGSVIAWPAKFIRAAVH